MSETVKAAIYTRVSTQEQVEDKKAKSDERTRKISLGHQRQRCEDFCKAHGWEIVQVYEDAGVSGAKKNRPALDAMLADAHEGKFQRAVFLKIDRFARNLRDLLNISYRLREFEVGIASVQEGFDTSTPAGRVYFHLLGAIAELERDTIAERTSMGRRAAARDNGHYLAGTPPYGYDCDPDTVKLVVNEEEADVIRRIYGMHTRDGLSYMKIAQMLTSEGVPTRGRRGTWHLTQVSRILKNPIYVGKGYYGKTKNVIDANDKRQITPRP